MSPIEEHLVAGLSRELTALGVSGATVRVLSAEAENWRYVVAAAGRTFEFGFNHRECLWCRETTPGQEKHLVSNDAAPIGAGDLARRTGLRLIRTALLHPDAIRRDPPII